MLGWGRAATCWVVRRGVGCRPALVVSRPLLITRNGKAVAVLLAVHDKAEAEQIAAGRSRSLRSIFAEAHEQIQKGGGIPHARFCREVERSRPGKNPRRARCKSRWE